MADAAAPRKRRIRRRMLDAWQRAGGTSGVMASGGYSLLANREKDGSQVGCDAERARVDVLVAALGRIVELHTELADEDDDFCAACSTSWPCATYDLALAALADRTDLTTEEP